MKRDMDLVREILIYVEENANDRSFLHAPQVKDGAEVSENEMNYHIKLLSEANLIHTKKTYSGWLIYSLTWEGHDFLDAAKNEGVWKRVQKTVSEKGGSLPFDVVKALTIQFAREAVGLG